MRALALLAAAALAVASPALAGTAVSLKADTFSADAVVTLGDLFDGAGAAADTPIASRTGASVVLNARAVQLAAARAGLDWPNAEGLRTVVVHGDPDDPSAPVRRQQHPKAVGQPQPLDGVVGAGNAGGPPPRR